ncbi:MAG TPA: hypothetical protein DD381_06770 [Lentisphaeria bacterium]|nr:MAG: hypothetical protein A2X47_13015 [Lentisphaerae bacterium GWF2_38_69]HBM16026.1 hypothetical protein [Lentisphaeria bacterium]
MKFLKYSAYTVGAILFAVAAGCVSYKPPPDIIHASNYTGESIQQHRTLPPDYDILTVEDSVNIALANNPSYKQVRLAVIQAYATYYGGILNNFTPGVGYSWDYANNGWGGHANGFTNGLSANYTVFNGLQNVMGTLANLASAKSSEEQERNSRRLLVFQVKSQYYQVLLDKANVQIQLANEAFQEQMVQDTQLQFDAGAKSLADLLNFKVQRNNAQKAVIQYTAQYYVDRFVLATYMGLTTADIPANTNFPTLDVLDDKGYALPVEFYLDMAINQRPDLQSSKELLKAAKYNLYSAWGTFSPTMSIGGGWGATDAGNFFPATVNRTSWNYGASVNWTLWDGGGLGGAAGYATGNRITYVQYNQAAYDVAQEALTATWIAVAQSVRTAYVNLGSNIAQRKIDGATLSMSKESRDLYVDQYNAGSIDIATLNQAQLYLVQAELAYVTDVINVATQRAALDAATGVKE